MKIVGYDVSVYCFILYILQKFLLTTEIILQRRCSEQDYSLSQEFEKQKAYFQEIDAFELPVEEVSSSDLD